jgi:hypothetical protein
MRHRFIEHERCVFRQGDTGYHEQHVFESHLITYNKHSYELEQPGGLF